MTGLRWSRRTTTTIAAELAKLGIAISPNTVARLLHDLGYSLRVNQKQISTSSSPNRNLQFEYLAELRYRFQRRHLPIVSVDSKKRELVGNFKNPGRHWESAPRRVYDHDFRTDSIGVAIPYGIYDVMENRGALVVGVSHETPAFAAHAIAHWWRQEGSTRYCGSRQLLILADTGGSNSCRCYAWKTELQSQLANSFCPGCDRGPLSHRRFQMESHRASPLLRSLTKLGG
jgi:Rhodopirellula transposase DDE domain